MYKIAIFDDESIIRKNIIKKIHWNKFGFEIVGEGENGREALDIIEEKKPDIIFTDIEMPFINGLELSKIVYESYPLIKVVLITGFDDFEYARRAVDLDVFKYILKPISAEQMINTLEKLKAQLDKEKEEKENIELLRKNYSENLPIMRENFYYSLITNKQNQIEIIEKAKNVNVNVDGNYYVCSVVNIDRNSIDNEKFKVDDYELIKFAVKNTAKEIIEKKSLGYVLIKDDYIVIIGRTIEKDKSKYIQKFLMTMEEVKALIQRYITININIGVGGVVEKVEDILESYRNALNALNYRFIMGCNKIIYIEDLEPQQTTTVDFDENKESNLINSIKFGSEKDVNDAIDSIFNIIKDIKLSFNEYEVYLLEIISSIVKLSKTLKLDINELFGYNYNLFVEMFKFNTIEELKIWVKNISLKIRISINEGRASSCKIHVLNAKRYIKDNYRDTSLSLNSISNYLHISSSYFGAIFKEETGETFSSYLLKIRMDKTKELISTTNLKNYEIAEMVGYTDQHYFSYSFKKYYKISPNEYKKSINKRG